jgi:hypothetical protein
MYLLWGWLVFICSLLQFVLLHFLNILILHGLDSYMDHYLPGNLYPQKNKYRTVEHTAYILGYVWLTFVIVIFLWRS